MAIAGLRGTGDWGTDERPKNFRETILWLNPNGDTPLTALMGRARTQSVDDPEFSWWEEAQDIIRLQLNDGTGMLAGDTTFVVDNGQNGADAQTLKPGDLLLVEKSGANQTAAYDNEIIRVTSVTNATTFVAARGQAGTTAAAIADDAWLTVIGSAYGEGTDAAEPRTRNPVKYSNLTQIFKDSYEETGTASKTRTRTGDSLANDKKRKMFEHSHKLELAMLFGKKHETTDATNGKPLRYTGGLLSFMAAAGRAKVYGAAVSSIDTVLDDLNDVFNFSIAEAGASDERIVLCGNGFLNAINKLAKAAGNIQYDEVVKLYGMNLRRMIIPQGSFMLKSHPLMNRHPEYTNSAFIINGSGLVYRPLAGRDTKPIKDIQPPGRDSMQGQWLTEAGLEPHHMQTMKFLTNLVYVAA